MASSAGPLQPLSVLEGLTCHTGLYLFSSLPIHSLTARVTWPTCQGHCLLSLLEDSTGLRASEGLLRLGLNNSLGKDRLFGEGARDGTQVLVCIYSTAELLLHPLAGGLKQMFYL